MGKSVSVGLGLVLLWLLPLRVGAADQFVTLVNPVRVSTYNADAVASLRAQYQQVTQRRLPATWLLTYDVIDHPQLAQIVKQMDDKQELGIFLEVSEQLAKDAQVSYHSGSWHFANVVFLAGYTQAEREKMIDTLFSKFQLTFGYMPKSVGSWWSDSYSLGYMQQKYGVIANLGVADQFYTDGYQVWGQYWSTPFLPRKNHAGLPAKGDQDSLGVVTIQWAPRHPRFGYQSSLYSTQDYLVVGERKLDTSFFKSLLDTYGQAGANSFGQVTVGLESDLAPDAYTGEYSAQLEAVVKSGLQPVTMTQFANWYLKQFGSTTPGSQIEADGVRWYQSPVYRIGLDKDNHQVIDLRVYPDNLSEPYYEWPDFEQQLFVYIPAVIDSMQNPDQKWEYGDAEVQLFTDHFEVTGPKVILPASITKSDLVQVVEISDGYQIWPLSFPQPEEGWVFTDWTSEAVHAFKSPRVWLRWLTGQDWQLWSKQQYFVSQSEIDALLFLKAQPQGKIMVVDDECLQCAWYGKFKPAVFANSRDYVSEFSHKAIVYADNVLSAKSQSEAHQNFLQTGAKYIYLVKYGDYLERLPFSPGDLAIKEIFENANSQIWMKTNE